MVHLRSSRPRSPAETQIGCKTLKVVLFANTALYLFNHRLAPAEAVRDFDVSLLTNEDYEYNLHLRQAGE